MSVIPLCVESPWLVEPFSTYPSFILFVLLRPPTEVSTSRFLDAYLLGSVKWLIEQFKTSTTYLATKLIYKI